MKFTEVKLILKINMELRAN